MKIDYKKLSIEFDLLLKKVTKEDFEKWYIMDNLRSKKINKMEKQIKVKDLKFGHVIEMADNSMKTVQFIEINDIDVTVNYIEGGCTHALSDEIITILV